MSIARCSAGPAAAPGPTAALTDGVRAACPLNQLAEGINRINGLAVVRRGGTIHAFSEGCPHGASSLADGVVRGGVITCPGHGARFRLRDGKAVAGPTRTPLTMLTAVVRGGVVLIHDEAPTRRPLLERLRDTVKEALRGQRHVC
jgi:3-phenylpropionate/trans-cinnamate dioxygenase ferredoxin subunit